MPRHLADPARARRRIRRPRADSQAPHGRELAGDGALSRDGASHRARLREGPRRRTAHGKSGRRPRFASSWSGRWPASARESSDRDDQRSFGTGLHGRAGAGPTEERQRALPQRQGALPEAAEGRPGRARQGPATLRHDSRVQRQPGAAGARVRRRLRRAVHRAGGGERPGSLDRGDAAVRRHASPHAAVRRDGARGLRGGAGCDRLEVPRRAAGEPDRSAAGEHPSRAGRPRCDAAPGCAAHGGRRSQRALHPAGGARVAGGEGARGRGRHEARGSGVRARHRPRPLPRLSHALLRAPPRREPRRRAARRSGAPRARAL